MASLQAAAVATWRQYAQRRGERQVQQLGSRQRLQQHGSRRVMLAWRRQAAEGQRLRGTAAQLLHM
jgi:hypothetical protein